MNESEVSRDKTILTTILAICPYVYVKMNKRMRMVKEKETDNYLGRKLYCCTVSQLTQLLPALYTLIQSHSMALALHFDVRRQIKPQPPKWPDSILSTYVSRSKAATCIL